MRTISVKINTALFTFFAVTLASTDLVFADEIKCPSFIFEQPTISDSPKEWTVVAKVGERPLEQVGIYLGSLVEAGAQVPDSSQKVKLKEIVTWNIQRSPEDTFWVGCSFVGTSAMMFQKIETKIKSCTATYELLPTGRRQRLLSMSCH